MAVVGGSLAVLLGCLAAGVAALAIHSQARDDSPFRASAGLALIVLALAQARILYPREVSLDPICAADLRTWPRLLAAAVFCYVGVAALGPAPGLGFLFLALIAGCYTVALGLARWPAALPRWREPLQGILQRRAVRALGWTAFGGIMISLFSELGLRTYDRLVDDHLSTAAAAKSLQLAPGATLRGGTVNKLGYWGRDFHQTPRPGVFRLAVLGDELALSGTSSTNCFAQLEHQLPGIEVYNFAIPRAGPRDYAAQLRREVLDYRPDLIVVLVSVGDDITEQVAAPGLFELRGLHLYQLAASMWLEPGRQANRPDAVVQEAKAHSEFLSRAERQLIVCRTPIDDTTRQQWEKTYSHFDDLIRHAERHNVEVALVAVPSACQVCPPLCKQLQRRLGYVDKNVDLELPQRRLASFASGRRVTWIDLLPALREISAPAFERSSTELSAAGNQAVAQTLEHWILGHFRQLVSPVAQASVR